MDWVSKANVDKWKASADVSAAHPDATANNGAGGGGSSGGSAPAPAPSGRGRSQSSVTFAKGQLRLKQKRLLGGDKWPELFFQLTNNEEGSLRLTASQAEGSNLILAETVTGVTPVEDRAGKKPNRFDVMTSTGKTVALSATKAEDKKKWLHDLRGALG